MTARITNVLAAIALSTAFAAPHAQAATLYAYNLTGDRLVAFDSSTPGTLILDVAITGLSTGQFLLGLDFRPANGLLYTVLSNNTNNQVATINTTTGAVTTVGGPLAGTSNALYYGIDFNPVVDRIRFVNQSGLNLRLNPADGTLAGTDAGLNPGTPRIVHVAYSNNFAGAASTTLYGIDSNTDLLVFFLNNPNGGLIVNLGFLGVNATDAGGFDIDSNGNAWAALRIGGVSILHSINLTTGAATAIGEIGSGLTIDGLSALPTGVPEPSTLLLSALGLASLLLRRLK